MMIYVLDDKKEKTKEVNRMNREEYEYLAEEILSNDDLSTCAQEVALNDLTKYYQEHKGYEENFLPKKEVSQ